MAVEYVYTVTQYARMNGAGGSSSASFTLLEIASELSGVLDGARVMGWPMVEVRSRIGRLIVRFTFEHGQWQATVAGYLIEEMDDGSWHANVNLLPANPIQRAEFLAFCEGACIEVNTLDQWHTHLIAWNPVSLARACEYIVAR